MKKILVYTCLLLLPVLVLAQQRSQAINPILGDESYIQSFGNLPDASVDEKLRIQTHLSYVEQLLRAVKVSDLSASQQENRTAILDMLHDYWTAGIFPVNIDYPDERRPCFIDDNGTICAVGYLVEQTKGRDMAEQINATHKYDFLLDMNEPAIAAWADENGLTLEECAMIQPSYGWIPPPGTTTVNMDIKKPYAVTSSVMIGANVAVNISNLTSRWNRNAAISWIGLLSGTGQIIMGANNIKKSKTNDTGLTVNYKKQNNLSYVNIAMGTTTLVSSALNLIINKNKKEKRTAFNLYSYPNEASSVTMGLSFTRRI